MIKFLVEPLRFRRNMCDIDQLPEGYKLTPGIGAHKLHVSLKTWIDAENTCIKEGGHLAVIKSEEEENIIIQLLNRENISDAYIGVHDLFKEGDWHTVEGIKLEDIGYSKWSDSFYPNPDNGDGNQNCIHLLQTGGMDDLECDDHLSFACKISCDSAA